MTTPSRPTPPRPHRRLLLSLPLLLLWTLLCGARGPCGGTTEPIPLLPDTTLALDGGAPPDRGGTDFALTPAWQAVAAAVHAQVSAGKVPGGFALLDVYDRSDGTLLFSRAFGDKAPARTALMAIASGSKWVTSTVILTLVGQGTLSLEDTTGTWLKWKGDKGAITLRQLLSFTSGLQDPLCVYLASSTLEKCVEQIRLKGLATTPGSTFAYGSAHMAVAGRIAEVATGKSWATLFKEKVATPLGWNAQTAYYALPKKRSGPDNPLLAGGLVVSPADYGKLLSAIQGLGAKTLISPALFAEQIKDQWAPGTVVGETPNPQKNSHYGLGCWRQCPNPDNTAACQADLVVHSTGAYGFVPWIDLKNGYYALFAAEAPDTQSQASTTNFLFVYNTLRSLIAEAVSGN